ncbi:Uma2 family endonuclease [Calothrix sp. UHCC 0171]|uniref:Uma2 family endonuclease n=1 Tax=Calothrix sp. UHCC 0171 TaxID=3110245 RepID=UPI002B1EF787|nr:Uma2 family endonuclease [Calothrix sp. UHCC 0171]MEA5569989.1 Uma2 family endonuclease [Calothrix sp. UHCC 0171]
MTTMRQIDEDLLYPSGDGKPMADNTEQYKWIVLIKENLEVLFADVPNVFIAGDLLWYPVRSKVINPTAPDVMVVFGRPKGKRKSYRQWREDNIPPQVVFEILSKSNKDDEMERKLEFYQIYGVQEYYIYDPESDEIEAWMRAGEKLEQIEAVNGWTSPLLGIKFDTTQGELVIYRPDGERFLTSLEMRQKYENERQRAEKLVEYLRKHGIDPDSLV